MVRYSNIYEFKIFSFKTTARNSLEKMGNICNFFHNNMRMSHAKII